MTEREWDKRLKIRTIGREDESNPNYAPYEPTPYDVLQRVAESGYIRRKQHVLDYGCGKGRVAFFLADAAAYRTAGASKAIPGFDVIDYGQEDYVFGNSETDARHWSKYVARVFVDNADTLASLFNAG